MDRASPGRVLVVRIVAVTLSSMLAIWLDPELRDAGPASPLAAAPPLPRDPSSTGLCFASGSITITALDPDELAGLVAEHGRNANLAPATEAVPDALALADRTGGELVASRGDEARVRYRDEDPPWWRIYTRFLTSAGDAVWIVTGTERRILCGTTE